MVSKCANPSCSVPFRSMRDGRLFLLEGRENARSRADQSVWSNPEPARKVRLGWLCNHCYSKSGVVSKPVSGKAPERARTASAGS